MSLSITSNDISSAPTISNLPSSSSEDRILNTLLEEFSFSSLQSPAISFSLFPMEIVDIVEKVKSMMSVHASPNLQALNQKIDSYRYIHDNQPFEGRGKCSTDDGCTFEGTWKEGKLHGEGSFIDSAATYSFQGKWNNGQREGLGTLRIEDSAYEGYWRGSTLERISKLQSGDMIYKVNIVDPSHSIFSVESGNFNYVGELEGGLFHGIGKLLVKSEIYYEGSFYGFERGSGYFNSINGIIYAGQWDKKGSAGEGALQFQDGFIYTGKWQVAKTEEGIEFTFPTCNNSKSNFQGKYVIEEDGTGEYINEHGVRHRGTWKDGKFEGETVNADGDIHYVGNSQEGYQMHHYSSDEDYFGQRYTGDEKYFGQMKDGKREGRGTFYWAGGMYVGEWHNDRSHGKGSLYNQNGELVYKGNFNHGLKEGYGTSYFEGKEDSRGMWKDNFPSF